MAKLFAKFGEFDSAEEINRAAAAQKAEGDLEALKVLAEENGIDPMDVEDFYNEDIPELCTALSAALGKLEIEKADIGINDMTYGAWTAAIQVMLSDDMQLCIGFRRKGRSLAEVFGKATAMCSKSRTNAPQKIVNEARKIDSSIPSPLPMGAISIAGFKGLVREYYIDSLIREEKKPEVAPVQPDEAPEGIPEEIQEEPEQPEASPESDSEADISEEGDHETIMPMGGDDA